MMTTNCLKVNPPTDVKLSDFDEKQSNSGMERIFTDPDTGAWVKITHDDTGQLSPIKDYGEGVEIAYIGYDSNRRLGTVDGIRYPDECEITCPRCESSGDDPDRWQITAHGKVIASGTFEAMDFVEAHDSENRSIERAACTACNGTYMVPVSLDRYLREEYGAIATFESSTGGYSQGDDARFVVIIIEDVGYEDLQAAARAWAEEYAAWARGDVYGIESSIGGDECYGFIGDENAKLCALHDFLLPAIEEVKKRRDANVALGEN